MAGERSVEELEAQKNGAYSERDRCVAALARMAVALGYRVGIARHVDDPWDDDWRNIVYIDLPTGQVSWHYHDSERSLFSDLPPYPGKWDGHSTDTKYVRLADYRGERDALLRVAEAGRAVIADAWSPGGGLNEWRIDTRKFLDLQAACAALPAPGGAQNSEAATPKGRSTPPEPRGEGAGLEGLSGAHPAARAARNPPVSHAAPGGAQGSAQSTQHNQGEGDERSGSRGVSGSPVDGRGQGEGEEHRAALRRAVAGPGEPLRQRGTRDGTGADEAGGGVLLREEGDGQAKRNADDVAPAAAPGLPEGDGPWPGFKLSPPLHWCPYNEGNGDRVCFCEAGHEGPHIDSRGNPMGRPPLREPTRPPVCFCGHPIANHDEIGLCAGEPTRERELRAELEKLVAEWERKGRESQFMVWDNCAKQVRALLGGTEGK